MYINIIQDMIDYGKKNIEGFEENEISDGNHTFNELYEFRKMYNAALFNEWGKIDQNDIILDFSSSQQVKYNVHKSWLHNDGEVCFPNSEHVWFIVSAMLPSGLISNHYKDKDWDLFKIPEVPKALYEYDGHTSKDVLERLSKIL